MSRPMGIATTLVAIVGTRANVPSSIGQSWIAFGASRDHRPRSAGSAAPRASPASAAANRLVRLPEEIPREPELLCLHFEHPVMEANQRQEEGRERSDEQATRAFAFPDGQRTSDDFRTVRKSLYA